MKNGNAAVRIDGICSAMLYIIRSMQAAAQDGLIVENKINFARELRNLRGNLDEIEKLLEAGSFPASISGS